MLPIWQLGHHTCMCETKAVKGKMHTQHMHKSDEGLTRAGNDYD